MRENLATTRLSSKGQVVIPEEIRESLNLKPGMQFVVIGKGDSVVLKAIAAPSFDEFEDLLKTARGQAKKAGLKRADISRIVQKVRKGK